MLLPSCRGQTTALGSQKLQAERDPRDLPAAQAFPLPLSYSSPASLPLLGPSLPCPLSVITFSELSSWSHFLSQKLAGHSRGSGCRSSVTLLLACSPLFLFGLQDQAHFFFQLISILLEFLILSIQSLSSSFCPLSKSEALSCSLYWLLFQAHPVFQRQDIPGTGF